MAISDEELAKSREYVQAKLNAQKKATWSCLFVAVIWASLIYWVFIPLFHKLSDTLGQVEKNKINIEKHKENDHGR